MVDIGILEKANGVPLGYFSIGEGDSLVGGWIPGQTYVAGAIVNYQGAWWVAIATNTGSIPPDNPSDWTLEGSSRPMTTSTDPASSAATTTAIVDEGLYHNRDRSIADLHLGWLGVDTCGCSGRG